MLNSRKALQSYIYALILVSILMSLILNFTLFGIYGEDHPDCNNIVVSIENLCKKDSSVQFDISNNGDMDFYFSLNDKIDFSEYRLDPKESKKLVFNLRDTNKLVMVPIVKGIDNNYKCNGKTQTKNTEVLQKC